MLPPSRGFENKFRFLTAFRFVYEVFTLFRRPQERLELLGRLWWPPTVVSPASASR